MYIEIPGYKSLNLKYLLLDYNGTIATDGSLSDSVRNLICEIAKDLDVFVLTADTHGTAAAECTGLPVTLKTFPSDDAMLSKLAIVDSLDRTHCCAIGNGRNDTLMCGSCELSICIMGEEGCYSHLINHTHITVKSIENALELLLKPKRLIATLRG